MKKGALVLLTTIIFGTLVGCSSSVPVADTPPDVSDYKISQDYTIGVSDGLLVSVWKNAELSINVQVRPDGKISMPLIGDIQAQGLTTKALTENITEALKTYLKTPQVAVIVQNAESSEFLLRVRATGAVNRSISIPHKDGMTVLDLILSAGGLTDYAAGNKAKLYRKVNGEVKLYPVRLRDILNKGKLETNYPLIPSDIVTVPERIL